MFTISTRYSSILLGGSHNNTLYHNNFINNIEQVNRAISYNNTWDNGVEGNYWSDYTGEDQDGDGIGDTPYIINPYNRDNYPLMKPWTELSWWEIHGVLVTTILAIAGGIVTLLILYIKLFRPKVVQHSLEPTRNPNYS